MVQPHVGANLVFAQLGVNLVFTLFVNAEKEGEHKVRPYGRRS